MNSVFSPVQYVLNFCSTATRYTRSVRRRLPVCAATRPRVHKHEQVAVVTAATTRIASTTRFDPSYLPGDANVHPCLIHGSFGARESAPRTACRILCPQRATSVAIGRIRAMNAMRPNNKAVIERRLRPRCCCLGSYFKRSKSSHVRPLACNWY